MRAAIAKPLRSLARPIYRLAVRTLPNSVTLRLRYLRAMRAVPPLLRPRAFNEKVLWRKLHDHDPRLPSLSDKLRVKKIIAETLGEEWIIPTLWTGTELPSRERRDWPIPYVLKATHGSGRNRFVRSPEEQDWEAIERDCRCWMANRYAEYGEWPYLEITPRLLVEPYLGSGTTPPIDYKFFVFGGRARFVQIDTDRLTAHKRVFYDREWKRQPFTLNGADYPLETKDIPAPASLARMIEAAGTLGEDFSFVRVDFYEIRGRPKFGEMTFFPAAGLGVFEPAEYDRMLGELWPTGTRRAR